MASADAATRVAVLALAIVAALTLANLLADLIAIARGVGYPYTTFVGAPDDRFGDFFSLIASYPGNGANIVADRLGLHAILPLHPPSMTVRTDPPVTNLHMMPFSTITDLAIVALARRIDLVWTFLALAAGLIGYWCLIARRFGRSTRERLAWGALGLLCYPMLLMLDRGNLLDGLAALLLVHAMLLGLQRRSPLAAALLMAVACNIRPNALVLALPMLLFYWPIRWRFSLTLGATGLAIVAASLIASTSLYPAYDLPGIRQGLTNFYSIYVILNFGLPHSSSLYSALKVLFGYHGALAGVATLISLALIAAGLIAHWLKRIDDATLLFVAIVGCCLGTTVLFDYHLVVLLAVPMALSVAPPAVSEAEQSRRRIMLITACLILAPKHYVFFGTPVRPVSEQVLINPLIMLGASLVVLGGAFVGRPAWRAWPRPATATA